jgi:hypothetical protein
MQYGVKLIVALYNQHVTIWCHSARHGETPREGGCLPVLLGKAARAVYSRLATGVLRLGSLRLGSLRLTSALLGTAWRKTAGGGVFTE